MAAVGRWSWRWCHNRGMVFTLLMSLAIFTLNTVLIVGCVGGVGGVVSARLVPHHRRHQSVRHQSQPVFKAGPFFGGQHQSKLKPSVGGRDQSEMEPDRTKSGRHGASDYETGGEVGGEVGVKVSRPLPGPQYMVSVTAYVESLCGRSMGFISDQLMPAVAELPPWMWSWTLVPFGRANETATESGSPKWEWSCQHGVIECMGNKVWTCALYDPRVNNGDQLEGLKFVNCTTGFKKADFDPILMNNDTAAMIPLIQSMCSNYKLDFLKLFDCAVNDQHFYHKMAQQTPEDPEDIPWIVVGGAESPVINLDAENNLIGTVCQSWEERTGGPLTQVCRDHPLISDYSGLPTPEFSSTSTYE